MVFKRDRDNLDTTTSHKPRDDARKTNLEAYAAVGRLFIARAVGEGFTSFRRDAFGDGNGGDTTRLRAHNLGHGTIAYNACKGIRGIHLETD